MLIASPAKPFEPKPNRYNITALQSSEHDLNRRCVMTAPVVPHPTSSVPINSAWSVRCEMIVVMIVASSFPGNLSSPSLKRVDGENRDDEKNDKQERVHEPDLCHGRIDGHPTSWSFIHRSP